MKKLSFEEIDVIAKKYLKLQKKSAKSDKAMEEFKAYQNESMAKLKCLISARSYRYRQFSNFPDLEQEGYEALLFAFRTYNPKKGPFAWWADKYIATRISRMASNHSCMRIPIKVARDMPPMKVSLDTECSYSAKEHHQDYWKYLENPEKQMTHIEDLERKNMVNEALKHLPNVHQMVLKMSFGLDGQKIISPEIISKTFGLSKNEVSNILKEAKNQIKENFLSQ